jgi:HEPN domain-containing protein
MNKQKDDPQEDSKFFINLGSFDFSGKGPGTYSGGVVKLYADPKEDLLDSAESFLKAADRCLNGCKVEEGIEMLTVPGTVCASFACELFLKYILLIETGENVSGHGLAELFKKCSKETQFALTEYKRDIPEIFERNNKQFIAARYHHEKDSISFRQQELLQAGEKLSKFIAEKYPSK